MNPNADALQYNAYKLARSTASKTRQVVMLYEGALKFIIQAKDAIVERRIEDRYNLLSKASEILMGLQSSLDFDRGEGVAQMLHGFYTDQLLNIGRIQQKNCIQTCDTVIHDLKDMLDVWRKIDAQQGQNVPPPAGMSPAQRSDSVTLSA